MAYLRTRNGYGYVCKKVKKEGEWKEETIVPLGKIKNEENKKRLKWIVETGMEVECDFATVEDPVLKDFIEDTGDKVKGKQLHSAYEWDYAPIEYIGKINPDELKITPEMEEDDVEKIEAKTGYRSFIHVFMDEEGKKYYW